MKTIYLLDWLISKHVVIRDVPDDVILEVGEKVVYLNKEDNKKYIGLHVGYQLETEREGSFQSVLTGQQSELFQ